MPVTPFHFGPGAALRGALGPWMSFCTFALANVLIDLEPITLFFVTGDPAHPYLHTLPGATAITALAVWPGRRLCTWALERWNAIARRERAPRLELEPEIPLAPALAGAALGAYSHIFSDSIMHADVHPLAPLSPVNFQGVIALGPLHLACVVAGGIGVALLAVRRVRKR